MHQILQKTVLQRDRVVVLTGLLGVTALAWTYLAYLALGMQGMDGGDAAMPLTRSWAGIDFFLTFAMWVAMMTGMMVPTAVPMVLMFASLSRRQNQDQTYVATAAFLVGYVVIWSGFAALATFAQWRLHSMGLLSPMLVSTSNLLGGGLLLVAGAYQWSPLKSACLSRCRTPLGFLLSEWRDGRWGALEMGLRHGMFCLGCCWALMTLSFVLGVMNLLWIAALATFVLVEKVAPAGHRLSQVSGLLLLAWGMWIMVAQGV